MRKILSPALAGLLIACAGGDPGALEGSRRAPASIADRDDEPGTMAEAPEGPASEPGGFGNSTVMPPAPPAEPLNPEEGCMVGERCAPTEPDPDDCGSLTLEAEVEVIENPGNVLLVFDRSLSMVFDWNGRARWEEAGDAIENALMPLADLLTVGSVFFPSSDPNAVPVCVDPTGITCIILPFLAIKPGSCGVNPITSADQLAFQPGPEFLTAFAGAANTAPPFAPIPEGLTPLHEGLQEAQRALDAATLMGNTAVIVITDGEPNCAWDVAAARQIVTDWAAAGIPTHVIGLPGAGDASGVLNELAIAGGTEMYIPADDPAALESKLAEIASQTVERGFDSCEITIEPPAEVPDKLHLVVTEGGADQQVPRDLSEDAGWNVTDDGSLVTLEGRLCDDATEGRFEALRFEFGCVDLPPLQPPPPLE